METLLSSSSREAMANENFRAILAMGRPAIPLVLQEISTRPDLLMAALPELTGENPVPIEARGDMNAMAAAWIDWYKEQKWDSPVY